MRRRLEIARGLLHSPHVLFLDEPTIGLDPQTRSSIWEYISELRRREQITVFVTTHYMDEAENCDRIAIMNEGEIAVIDTPEALKSGIGADRVQIRTSDDDAAIAQLQQIFGLEAAVHEGAVTFAVPGGAQFVPRLFSKLDVAIEMVTVTRPSLDDVFMTYTGTTIRDAEARSAGRMTPAFMRMMSR
jgi:ABC-2 type transport system ATP-binding protein